ncbi:hypothetical protein C8F04DRAFT_1082286 [Mycena alexandri]|uniref:Uncharacterized protein n=1 Tax=Mycena alexandri TaxID=1745969 RepID=A0AAD6XAG0_9AGAR|nr:hypothetical protein C8F04DRAFT_1082286 [Mycena alexandri]
MARRKPTGFFDGATNFEINGGVFNEIGGDLNQYYTTHHAVQHNIVHGDFTRYNSPTIVNFGLSPPPPPFNHINRNILPPPGFPTFNHGNPSGPVRGLGRGCSSGVRMEPYNTARGFEPTPSSQSRSNRPGRGGSAPSPYHPHPSSPVPDRGPEVYPRSPQYPQPGSSSSPRRFYDPWAYTPPPQMPPPPSPAGAAYRNPNPAEDDAISDGGSVDTDDESDEESDPSSPTASAVPSWASAGPSNSNDRRSKSV